jgi:cobalt/nickel transport system permease protein
MFNIPLPGGTTGHAVGAVLSAILLGPYAASIATTIALLIQALFFGDGGILAFGANCFNLAFIMPFSGYFIYEFLKSVFKGKIGENASVFFAGYVGVVLAALFTAIEFGIQPILFKDAVGMPLYCPYDLKIAVPAMLIPHLLVVGFLEGFITLGVYRYVKKIDSEVLYKNTHSKITPLYALLSVLIVFSPIGLLAAGTAWGEWGLDELKSLTGFTPNGMEKGINFNAIMPDYTIPGIPEAAAYIASAVVGTGLIILIFRLIFKNKKLSRG